MNYLAALVAIASLGLAPSTETKPDPRPNILLFLIDDLGWTDLGCQGSDLYETPHIDRLADEGMRFTQAYANAANCMPSRACLMTGQYTPRHGIYNIASPRAAEFSEEYRRLLKRSKLIPIPNKPGLRRRLVTLPEALKAAGYRTGFIGKWHHGQSKNQSDFDVTHILPPRWQPQEKNGPGTNPKLTPRITTLANEFLGERREEPFFLMLSYHAVHLPIEANPATIETYARQLETLPSDEREKMRHRDPAYAAMVKETDTSVGRVLDRLEDLELADETVVLFFSDNGGHGRVTSNLPLRGEKQMIYEGGIRVPLIVRWPGRIKRGSVSDVPVIGTDFYPTFLQLAQSPPPKNHPLDGVGLVELLRGESDSLDRDALYWHTPSYWHQCEPTSVIRAGDHKLIEWFETGELELFDLANDPGESRNLARAMPEKTRAMHQKLLEWRTRLHAPIPTEPNPDYEP
ncbi:Arylsulfatase [Planctomycetes bacterium Pan216]|uniref:Arylsulfatase n=1 Tax=Kolteria novifilia TaxID=2527975 RepID=A0A518B1B6_9BACT|nr:Arylsulfatase [Planctomycetes bacterium Pan216]